MTTGASVSIRDLVVHFGKVVALDRINLEVRAGELFMLLGSSGCGKTTLLRTIAGFNEPTSGTIALGDRDVTHLPPQARGAAMVFQSFALWPHLSVEENVAFGLHEKRVPRREVAAAVAAALESTRLSGFGRRSIDELSGGEQQRVALARSLVVRPRCLLLDEPLSNLDASLRQSMRGEIRRICKEFGLTAVYVTHDQKEAMAVADRMAVVHAGRIVQVGEPRDVYRRPTSRAVATFVGATNLMLGRVVAVSSDSISVEAASLTWVADRAGTSFEPGDRVWVSVRPECFRTRIDSQRPNIVQIRRESSIFLGEVTEHRLRVGAESLIAYELNAPHTTSREDSIAYQVDPCDVVLLPIEPGEAP
ncbi:MAG TPA: ABC transporter ATP-binding protein [Polyangiaceae bacterium]|nr:ABC transporter ATP-binding protein [Polyangiaceae bacterium]